MINQSECKNEMQNFSYNNCFICGAKQTFWILNSKPSTGFPKKPFFPFIQHHPNRNNQQKLNTSKECYACNVCYFLLLQQWKSFENRKTPTVKRLYWMKTQFEFEEDITNAISDSKFVSNVLSSLEATKLFTCYLCRFRDDENLSSIVYTVPQESAEVPFFSSIVRENDKERVEMNGGKVLLCKQCSSVLHQQWVDYQENDVPFTERKYFVGKESQIMDKVENFQQCFLCQKMIRNKEEQTLYIKLEKVNEPYYPFLLNLRKPSFVESTSISIGKELEFSCTACKEFLYSQWAVFNKMDVPQEERVYRIYQSQKPFTLSKFNHKVACLLCKETAHMNHMKRIYCNPGANLFTELKDRVSVYLNMKHDNLFYDGESGETFVCLPCFKDLLDRWKSKHGKKLSGIDMNNNDIIIKDINKEPEINSPISQCPICQGKPNTFMSLLVTKPENDLPYFPFLKSYIIGKDSKSIETCQKCALALVSQWNNRRCSKDNSLEFKTDLFWCVGCEKSLPNDDMEYRLEEDSANTELRCTNCTKILEDKVCFLLFHLAFVFIVA